LISSQSAAKKSTRNGAFPDISGLDLARASPIASMLTT
jgi:hypothetical protein